MKKNILKIIALYLIFVLLGCSTIFTGTSQNINFTSEPSSAKIEVINAYTNMQVYTGTTPATVVLSKGDGYFKSASYIVKISKDGYETFQVQITGHLTGWYIAGNILVGGLIGWLIVDPISGGMWTLSPENISSNLTKAFISENLNEDTIKIVLKESIPDDVFNKLKLVQLQ